MPRSNWKGHISFGLVSIPILLFNSIEPKSGISFKQINKKTGAKIKYKRIDSETEKEVPWGDIGKGYEYAKDVVLPVGDDELKKVAGENARTIAIEEFIDKKNIDFIDIEHAYYLIPDKHGEKGYVILREALKSANKIGIAKVIISTKEYLAAVSTFKDVLVLYLLYYNEEIRQLSDFKLPSDDIKKYKVTTSEIEIAKKLIHAMTKKWQPKKFKDEYKQVVEKWVQKKVHHLPGIKMEVRSAAKKSAHSVNFIDLLKKSLQKTDKPTAKIHVSKKTKSSSRRTVNH